MSSQLDQEIELFSKFKDMLGVARLQWTLPTSNKIILHLQPSFFGSMNPVFTSWHNLLEALRIRYDFLIGMYFNPSMIYRQECAVYMNLVAQLEPGIKELAQKNNAMPQKQKEEIVLFLLQKIIAAQDTLVFARGCAHHGGRLKYDDLGGVYTAHYEPMETFLSEIILAIVVSHIPHLLASMKHEMPTQQRFSFFNKQPKLTLKNIVDYCEQRKTAPMESFSVEFTAPLPVTNSYFLVQGIKNLGTLLAGFFINLWQNLCEVLAQKSHPALNNTTMVICV